MLIIVLHKIFEGPMSPTRVEVELLHLGVNLVEVPVIVLVPIDGTHSARAMSSAGAMKEKLARSRIIGNFQEHVSCFLGRILLRNHWNVDELHSQRFDC